MKKRILLTATLLATVVAFGQKRELRNAEKAIKKAEFSEAMSFLNAAKNEALASDKYAPKYYFLLGELNFEKAKRGQDVMNSLQQMTENFTKSAELDNDFVSDMNKIKAEAVNIALKRAQDAYKSEDYVTSADGFEQVYRLSPADTVFLYNAAVVAVQNKDYDKALNFYKELKDMNYNGSEVIYLAKNKESGEEEQFPNKSQRDLMVKGGTHTNPKDNKTESKRAEIIKNIALIYVEQGKNDEAVNAFEEARKMFPDDASLVIAEANIYLQLDNKDKFKELMLEASRLEPNNADLQYNIGVINMQQNDYKGARDAFEKALSIRSDYADAVLNYSTTYIYEGNAIAEEMNKLGNTKADNAKYDKFKEEKDGLFEKAAKVLNDYTEKNGKNESVLEQLKNIYGALGDTANFKRVKDMMDLNRKNTNE